MVSIRLVWKCQTPPDCATNLTPPQIAEADNSQVKITVSFNNIRELLCAIETWAVPSSYSKVKDDFKPEVLSNYRNRWIQQVKDFLFCFLERIKFVALDTYKLCLIRQGEKKAGITGMATRNFLSSYWGVSDWVHTGGRTPFARVYIFPLFPGLAQLVTGYWYSSHRYR